LGRRNLNQRALALKLPQPGGFDRFVANGNEEPLAALRDWTRGGERYLYLHGGAGSGKSHLLQAACGALVEQGLTVIYLPLDEEGPTPAMLEDLEQRDAVIVDALPAIAGNADWERALFDLYNRLLEADRRLLVSARVPPPAIGLRLADLTSRLSAGAAYRLQPLDEDGCATLLSAGAAQRGLRLDQAAIDYILTRCPRDPASLVRLLDDLDRLSLEQQRALNVRSIGDLLGVRTSNSPN
jgi:DnaA family protein